MNLLEFIESIHTGDMHTDDDHYDPYYVPPAAKPIQTENERQNMTNIYRYLIYKYPELLTAKGALSVFRFDDKELNEEVVRILQRNQSPDLFELYWSILGTKKTHNNFRHTVTPSRYDKPGSSGLC